MIEVVSTVKINLPRFPSGCAIILYVRLLVLPVLGLPLKKAMTLASFTLSYSTIYVLQGKPNTVTTRDALT